LALLAVVLILIAWAVIGVREAAQPKNPPIDDVQEHCKTVMQLPNKKTRRKYLKDLSKRR
jgi:hypothetical protein